LDGGSARHKAAVHRTTQRQNKRTQISMPLLGFEATIPVFELAKTVHSLDRAAAVIGHWLNYVAQNGRMTVQLERIRKEVVCPAGDIFRTLHREAEGNHENSQSR
jgi:hypothetical protein